VIDPHSSARVLLGSVMLRPELFDGLKAVPPYAFPAKLQPIYQAMGACAQAGEEPGLMEVRRRLNGHADSLALLELCEEIRGEGVGPKLFVQLVDDLAPIARENRVREILQQAAGASTCLSAADLVQLGQDTEEQLRVAMERADGARLVTRCLADVEARPVEWLWRDRIPLGMLSLLAGHPGLGKTWLCLYLAACVSRGATLTDGSPCPMGRVVILTAEDDASRTIRPRIDKLGGDPYAITLVDAYRDAGKERSLHLDTDAQELDRLLTQLGDVKLVFIDPISAYLGAVDSHNNADVRGALAPLSALAEKHGCAVVLISHLNKGGREKGAAHERIMGSAAFVAACRSVYGVWKDGTNPANRLFLPVKVNVAQEMQGLVYQLDGDGIHWSACPTDQTAEQASAANPSSEDDRSALTDAQDFLRDTLRAGPMPSKQLLKEGSDAGISARTLNRAKVALGVLSLRVDSQWAWQLPCPL
jgi:putative DNA primase/helicase